jgi:molybdenum cofactor cytidylyltransferase
VKPHAAIILAAGFSRRMEKFKPLLLISDETFTDRLISVFLDNGVEVYLVAGNRAAELKEAVKNWDIVVVENPDYALGMFTSVQVGVRALLSIYEAFFIMPVDIPLIRPFTIRWLMAASVQHPGKIVYPVFRKMRGHPPLIPMSLAPTITGWEKDGSLRDVLDSFEGLSLEVSVPDRNILLDINTADDYRAVVENFQYYEVPTDEECEVILKDVCRVPPDVHRHSLKVAEVAQAIGRALLEAGQEPDLAVIRAAAMLHDIDRNRTDYDKVGRLTLGEMGFGRIADIVSMQAGITEGETGASLESKVLYLADKFVEGESVIDTTIAKCSMQALNIKHEFEYLLGYSLENIIFK